MKLSAVLVVMVACGGGSGDCPVGGDADADALREVCVAKCRAVIGCENEHVDDNGDWVCDLVPGCRSLTPKEAAEEMFECDGTCSELYAATDACGAVTDEIVRCFDALGCEAFATEKTTDAIDSQCQAELACFDGVQCFE